MPVADPSVLYSPGDFKAVRNRIFEDSLNAVRNRFPIENSRYSLSLEDVDYENPREFSLKEQKAAVQNDQSLSWKMRGSWVLRDKATGNVVSKSSKRTVMNVPYMTERGTFIRNGTETTLPLQMRLVPGVYTRMGEDNIAKAHINARPGTGNTVMMQLNPAKPVFRVSVGTRNYDLFPLLKHLGVTDEEMIAAWGRDLYNANKEAFMKAGGWYKAKTAADAPDPNDPWEKAAKDVLGGELDPDNTTATFGTAYTKVDPQLLLASSKRLVGLAKGEHSGDNRDSMENQRFFGPAEFISERIRLDAGGLLRNLLWRTSRYGDAQRIPSSPLSKYVDGLFTESKLAQSIEETNLMDAYKRATMVTRMGEGGIGSIESAPMSARLVHNTYKGFIDPVSSPECTSDRHMVFTNRGWKKISEVTTDDMVACMIDGRLEYHHPEQIVSYDYDGELYAYKNDAVSFELTGNHRMWVRKCASKQKIKKNGHIQKEYKPVYGFEYMSDMYNTNRRMMGGGHQPLLHPVRSTKEIISEEDSYHFSMRDWCEFLGWYISEGSVLHKGGYHRWVMIAQAMSVNAENCERIGALLDRMHIAYRFDGRCFNITSRALWNELHVLGYCKDKYIPEEIFEASYEDQSVFIEALLLGDGRKAKRGAKHPPVLCTTSKKLAEDYERLLVERGEHVSVCFEKDDREARYLGCYTVRILVGKELWLIKNGRPISTKSGNRNVFYYHKIPYKGKVWCLTVPGGLFLTKIEGFRSFWTGNSLRVGLDTQIARSARRGPDGLMYAPLLNPRTGQREYVSTLESSKVPVSFPEYMNSKSPLIPAMVGNDIEMVPKSKVAYFVPNGDSLFATASNFIPIKSGIKAGRLLMAQKHQTQAMSIKDRMAPYIQSLDPDGSGKSVEEVDSGILGAVRADQPGRVVKVTKDDITVLQADGTKHTYSLYNNFPLNRKSVVNNTAEVKPGDMVDKGTLLASSSYTDKNGVAAMGTQLRTGWLSFKGWNYLDAIVVSESAAKKLTSEHFYHEGVDRDEGTSIDRDRYISAFPGKFNRDQLATIDTNGAVKPGTIVKKGDPLVLAMSLRPGGPGTGYRALHKDVSAVWEHDFPGEVTDVVDAKDGARVYVKSWVPLQTGDKLATRFANKGTSALVVPDERMPRAADGRPLEVLFSPTGIVSRVNSAALIEAALGKVAEKTGKRYILPGFGTDLVKFAKKELKEAGLTDREDVTDPDTGRIIPGVFVGNSYITKFHHTSESKGGARATGAYTADEQPATGGHDGAKTLGGLVLGAFAGHGASEVLKDMKLIKGQKNTDFWRDFKMGRTPVMPGTPLIYKRFLASLEASGIHVTRDGDNTNIFAMTNGDVRKQARAELKNATTYDEKKFLPMKGGLFDPAIFGQNGDQWAYIPVDEPILNPVMDDVVCNFLNLKKAELDDVISGVKKLPNGLTGGEGLRKQLASLNLDTMIENAKNTIRSGPVSRRDKAVKTLRWASAMKKHDVTPDQFMLDEVPVLPPRYRRITRSGDLNMVADANYLYKELLDARNDLREAKEAGLPDELLGYGRKRVTDAFRAVTGLADPSDTKLRESGVSGLLKWVFGKGSPKCHDDKTEILTEVGWMPFPKYREKRFKVAVFNESTRRIEYRVPKDVIHEQYQGDMVHIVNDNVDALVTLNHNLYMKCPDGGWDTRRAFTVTFVRFDTGVMLSVDDFYTSHEVEFHSGDVSFEPYDGFVHCVTVDGGLIVTRRNGKTLVGGNSGGYQRLVVGGKLDVAGRGVINIDPRLGLDEVGVPENQAWGLYRDFIIRKLVQGGMNPLMATKAAVEHSPSAKEAMLRVMSERPLIITRAPALHKYSVQAFRPKLVVGDTMKLNSVVEHGFNADFDGNCVDYDTEIFLQSALDNPVSQSILNSVRANGAREVSLGELTMITDETTAIFASTTRNNFYYDGPIGKLPRLGEPKKDRNGADVYELPEDILVWSYDHATNEFGWHRATHFTVEQDCEVCDVRIGTLHVKMSTNDSMSVFDQKTGDLVKQAPEKSVGAFVPICRELPKMTCMGRTGTFNAGWLHGMMLGDGWLSGNYVGFTKLEEAKLNTFISRLSEHLGTEIHYNVYEGKASSGKFGDSRKIHMNDKAVVAWASDLEMYDGKDNIRDTPDRAALHKWIHPTYLYIKSDEYLWGLLSGLIDSDGSVTRAVKKGTGKVVIGVTYSTCSPSMKDTLIGLAHRLGIKAGYSEGVHKKGKDRKVETVEYCVMLSGPDVQANLGNISCVGYNETTRIEEWKAQEPYADNHDVIPMSDAESRLLMKLFPHRAFPSFYVIASKKQAARRTLMKYLWMKEAKDKELDNLRRRVSATGVVWYPVTEVTPLGKREVFDLCVPDTKVFVVNNGPVVWDTMTYYVPVSNKAVEEAYNIMTPSKNLLAARDFKSMPEMQEELVSGAWFASHRKNTPPKAVFNTKEEALQAYLHGQIKADDNVVIKDMRG